MWLKAVLGEKSVFCSTLWDIFSAEIYVTFPFIGNDMFKSQTEVFLHSYPVL